MMSFMLDEAGQAEDNESSWAPLDLLLGVYECLT